MSPFRWPADRLKDLLYDPTNTYLDPGRVAGWIVIVALLAAAGWDVHLHKELDLSATGFPAGLTALFGAVILYIHKDRQRSAQGSP